MKKMLFSVLLLCVLAVPASAVVNIAAVPVTVDIAGDMCDTDEVMITYEVVGDPCVRAFAIDITVSPQDGEPDGNCAPLIVGVNEPDLNVDYWVYPGSIDINEAGEVNDVGTPIGDPCQLVSDTLGGLDTNGITIEMGSLYVGEANAPATSGVLLKIVIDDNCKIEMAENVSRGGVVLEGVGSKATVNFTGANANLYTGTDAAKWRQVGKPKCWCRSYRGSGRQCHGDADGRGEGKNGNIWVSTWDAQVFNAAKNKTYAQIAGQTVTTGKGDVLPWVCADFDHIGEGKAGNIAVSTFDAGIFNTYKNLTTTPQDCP